MWWINTSIRQPMVVDVQKVMAMSHEMATRDGSPATKPMSVAPIPTKPTIRQVEALIKRG
jgi:hypothetical protein